MFAKTHCHLYVVLTVVCASTLLGCSQDPQYTIDIRFVDRSARCGSKGIEVVIKGEPKNLSAYLTNPNGEKENILTDIGIMKARRNDGEDFYLSYSYAGDGNYNLCVKDFDTGKVILEKSFPVKKEFFKMP